MAKKKGKKGKKGKGKVSCSEVEVGFGGVGGVSKLGGILANGYRG